MRGGEEQGVKKDKMPNGKGYGGINSEVQSLGKESKRRKARRDFGTSSAAVDTEDDGGRKGNERKVAANRQGTVLRPKRI